AMTFLLRSRGIPARVATGYAVPRARLGQASAVLVQSTDGHAWCEVYLHGAGWVPLDVSPERNEEPPFAEPSPQLTHHFREQFAKGKNDEAREDEAARLGAWLKWLGRLALLGAAALALGVVALLYLTKAWRRLAPGLASTGQLYRVCYRATLDRLADVGLTRQFGETREA